MFKKIKKQLKHITEGSSKRRHGHYNHGSSSSKRHSQNPMSGSNRYKRKGRSSS
ncbi:hypothetical protein [Virgibacillus sp. L01]|uniref:hypothetical protein n=1 Tax=Virgibacillus sp. L01 TaxID=3457429 RepID=UPI003FD28551